MNSLTSSDIARVFTSAQHQLEIQRSLRQFNTLRKNMRRKHKFMEENMKKFGKKIENSTNKTIEKLLDSLRDFIYHSLSVEEIVKKMKTNPIDGLTEEQANERMTDGENQVEGLNPPNAIQIYFNQVSDPFSLLLWLLIVLSIIAYVLVNDSNQLLLAIILFITINSVGVIAYYYERKSYEDVDALNKLVPQFATVIRDGAHKTVLAKKIVKGDIVVLKNGEKSPADLRIIESNGMKINRSSFTGQSEHIAISVEPSTMYNPLDSPNMAFSGVMVEDGDGTGVVVNIGENTLIAGIKEVIKNVQKKQSYLGSEISNFVKWITIFALAIGIFTFAGGAAVGFPVIIAADIAIGVAVASAPGILNLELVCILSFAMSRLAKNNMVCKRMTAAESLGSTEILCTDKTGTLTTNRMTMQNIYYDGQKHRAGSYDRNFENTDYNVKDPTFVYLMKCAVLSSISRFDQSVPKEYITKISSRTDLMASEKQMKQKQIEDNWKKSLKDLKFQDRPIIGDSTESALVRFFQPIRDIEEMRLNFPIAKSSKENREIRSTFSSVDKHSFSIHYDPGPDSYYTLYLKGAPERVWGICRYVMKQGEPVHKSQKDVQEFNEILETWGNQGKRLLAFAMVRLPSSRFHKKFDFSMENRNFSLKGLTFLGVVSLHDPPRKGVPETINKLKKAGIKVVMVTGDQEITAIQIGRQCNVISKDKTSLQIMKQQRIGFKEAFVKCRNVIINGDQLTEMMGEEELKQKHEKGRDFMRILEKDGIIFARTTPAQKLYITEKFQSLGYYTTVSGDGVNDSPAIKIAHTGLAMNCGSDAAKDAADIILMNDDFNSISIGIEEGRRLFDNFKKAICYVMTSQVSEWMPFVFLITSRIPIPIFTLLIDGAVDFIPTLAFAFESSESGIMTRPPKHQDEPLITYNLLTQCQGWMGFSSFICCLLAYYIVMIDFGFVPSKLWGKSNTFILLQDLKDHFNASDPYLGNSNLRGIKSCDQFNQLAVRVDWINTTYPWTDLRMSAVECFKNEATGQIYFKPYMTFSKCRVQQISFYTNRPVCYTPEATKYGQTSYMLANVVNQIFNWFICRTRFDSTVKKRLNNVIFVFGIGFEILLAMALCYTQFMNQLISTRDCAFVHWGLSAIPFGMIQLTMDEIRKYLVRNLPPNKNGKPNWFARNTLW